MIASELICTTFDACVADDWTKDAANRFRSDASPDRLAESLTSAAYQQLCFDDERLIGIVLLSKPYLLSLLFVDRKAHRKGIASKLLENALSFVETNYPETRIVELNATPQSVPFYTSRGFFPISPSFTYRGCRVTRMGYWMHFRAMKRDDC